MGPRASRMTSRKKNKLDDRTIIFYDNVENGRNDLDSVDSSTSGPSFDNTEKISTTKAKRTMQNNPVRHGPRQIDNISARQKKLPKYSIIIRRYNKFSF